MMPETENHFHKAMINIYKRAKDECAYNAVKFKSMVSEYGGLATAKLLLKSNQVQYGFTELWQCKRLDLTVEAHVLRPEFSSLFTKEELKEAKTRLEKHGYCLSKAEIDSNNNFDLYCNNVKMEYLVLKNRCRCI